MYIEQGQTKATNRMHTLLKYVSYCIAIMDLFMYFALNAIWWASTYIEINKVVIEH